MSNVCEVGEGACLPTALLCPLQAVCQGTGPPPLPSIPVHDCPAAPRVPALVEFCHQGSRAEVGRGGRIWAFWAGTSGRCLLPPLGSHLPSAAFSGLTLGFLSLSPSLIPSGWEWKQQAVGEGITRCLSRRAHSQNCGLSGGNMRGWPGGRGLSGESMDVTSHRLFYPFGKLQLTNSPHLSLPSSHPSLSLQVVWKQLAELHGSRIVLLFSWDRARGNWTHLLKWIKSWRK